MGDAMRRAWEDWLAAECSAHPVLLVLEDLQWGDLGTVSFIDAALRNLREQPFIVLALLYETSDGAASPLTHWRHIFWIFGLIGVVWCVAFWFWFHDRPEARRQDSHRPPRRRRVGRRGNRNRRTTPNRLHLRFCIRQTDTCRQLTRHDSSRGRPRRHATAAHARGSG